jgi:hypothetical protein
MSLVAVVCGLDKTKYRERMEKLTWNKCGAEDDALIKR